MRRLTPQEIEHFTQPTPFQKVMEIWRRWNALSDHPVSLADMHPQDTKEFMAAGEAADVMINALPRHLWWAVMKSNGVATVWLFPNLNLADAMCEAEEILSGKMQKHIVTRRYFR